MNTKEIAGKIDGKILSGKNLHYGNHAISCEKRFILCILDLEKDA